jgi:hypothetical protein
VPIVVTISKSPRLIVANRVAEQGPLPPIPTSNSTPKAGSHAATVPPRLPRRPRDMQRRTGASEAGVEQFTAEHAGVHGELWERM